MEGISLRGGTPKFLETSGNPRDMQAPLFYSTRASMIAQRGLVTRRRGSFELGNKEMIYLNQVVLKVFTLKASSDDLRILRIVQHGKKMYTSCISIINAQLTSNRDITALQ